MFIITFISKKLSVITNKINQYLPENINNVISQFFENFNTLSLNKIIGFNNELEKIVNIIKNEINNICKMKMYNKYFY